MCGRTSLFADPELVRERFDADPVRPLEPRYNVSPGQSHPVVRNDDPDAIRFPTWGLVPEWSDDSPSSGHVNARSETLTEKPSFREAFAERRCLVLADGFYDWKPTPTGKQPYRIEREDREPFAFAGLWEPRSEGAASSATDDAAPDGGTTNGGRTGDAATFTIVTTEPNAVVEEVHHRMPVMLSPGEERQWLETDSTDALADLLDPYPAEEMHAYPVSSAVNDPKNDAPELLEEVAAEEDVQTGLDEF
ncbi:SOS response-associated peptidase [Halorussus gelatinilyticus]|uniref:SOS response-associated peptidase n=1 Tax=Halorussus gelatinilyticus TaxID=2937524 RepID=A0A8U0ILE6_9EURY|nr:SOS response-associated peptidase [Halorussus gelatinilyticus]UPW01950.1 SOS response-associated peptidase [Halorussus gelatinilyticus]